MGNRPRTTRIVHWVYMHDAALRRLRPAAFFSLMCLIAGRGFAQVTPWQTAITASPDAQTLPEDRGADGLAQTLKKLHTWGSLMMIVAHPDDEDGGMLTLESRGFGARTAILTLTRGEGGQNAMSSETYDALGLIRTNELLLADEYSGTEQFFSRVADYGFSKTIEEAHEKWGRDRVLYDVVRAVRLYRPLVITSVFTGNITDGHGHHQVAGEAAQLAFKMAGDPTVFPDQIAQGLRPWSPLKVYARNPFFSATSRGIYDYATNKWSPVRFYDYVSAQWNTTVPPTDIEVHEGTFDPILSQSYIQIAREGWSQQKSQNGGGNIPLRGTFDVGYHRYGSRVPDNGPDKTFFDGIDTSLPGIATLAHGETAFLTAALKDIDQHVMTATFGYLPSNPEKIAPELIIGYKKTKDLIEAVNSSALPADDKGNVVHELEMKLTQFNIALAQALGLQVNAVVIPRTPDKPAPLGLFAEDTPTTVTPSSEIDVRLHVASAQPWTAGGSLRLTRTWLESSGGVPWKTVRLGAPGMDTASSSAGDVVYRVTVPRDAPYTRPYFTRPNPEQPYYDISDPTLANQPLAPYPLAGWAEFNYDGVPVRLGQVVQTVHREHGYGSLYQPLAVVPKISVNVAVPAGIVPLGSTSFALAVSVRNSQQAAADGTLRLDLPAGWTCDPPAQNFHLRANESAPLNFTIHPSMLAAESYTIKANAQSGYQIFSEGFETIGYPGLRPYYLYRAATYGARGVDVKVAPTLNVGYVMGTGDDVPLALEQMGIHAHLLSPAEIASGDLSRYDTILVGIRAYSNRPDLAANNHRLLDYVQRGGNLVVQYQSGDFDQYGPYPYTLISSGRLPERVVDETAPVTIMSNPVFDWPNRITSRDFDGWIEERGHSFLESWDSRYVAPTETHDPGQDPQRGGLLIAHYGKGTYIYVAFALYRQFPEAVPGAYRILANLISLGKNRGETK
ncbi:MAG: PIG-L family deacetylase [Acidobacteriaceae bacterium]|nr:PIG-L family deacetylase [Acidobacteriaceae bacterium]